MEGMKPDNNKINTGSGLTPTDPMNNEPQPKY